MKMCVHSVPCMILGFYYQKCSKGHVVNSTDYNNQKKIISNFFGKTNKQYNKTKSLAENIKDQIESGINTTSANRDDLEIEIKELKIKLIDSEKTVKRKEDEIINITKEFDFKHELFVDLMNQTDETLKKATINQKFEIEKLKNSFKHERTDLHKDFELQHEKWYNEVTLLEKNAQKNETNYSKKILALETELKQEKEKMQKLRNNIKILLDKRKQEIDDCHLRNIGLANENADCREKINLILAELDKFQNENKSLESKCKTENLLLDEERQKNNELLTKINSLNEKLIFLKENEHKKILLENIFSKKDSQEKSKYLFQIDLLENKLITANLKIKKLKVN